MSIPFKLPDFNGGLYEGSGFLRLEPEYLAFEVQVAALGLFKSDSEIIKVEPGVVADVSFEKGLIRDKIRILPAKFELLKAFPGNPMGEIILKTKRKHRAIVRAFVNDIRRWKHEAASKPRSIGERADISEETKTSNP